MYIFFQKFIWVQKNDKIEDVVDISLEIGGKREIEREFWVNKYSYFLQFKVKRNYFNMIKYKRQNRI